MIDHKEWEEKLFPVAGIVQGLIDQFKEEDWQTRLLISSCFFHSTCKRIGIDSDLMCYFIKEMEKRDIKRITQ